MSDELVEYFDLDSDLEDDEVSEIDDEENWIVNNYDNYINMGQILSDLSSTNYSTYKPAQIIRILSKTPRTLVGGQIVIDYELEIEGVSGAVSYEVRVMTP